MKKIIFDTDIGGDCDDAGALALIHQAENLGLAKLIACVVSHGGFDGAGCTDVINRYYGHVVPIGQVYYIPDGPDVDEYAEKSYGRTLYRQREHSYKDVVPPQSVKVLRKALAENTGEKITFVVVGSFENVSDLMKSGPDEISELTGMELIEQQVDCIVAAAGDFENHEVECNISSCVHGAINVCKNSPVPIVFTHYTEGANVFTGKIIHETDPENPVGIAYYICMKGGNRCSWDPMAAFYAIYGCEDIFRLTNPGTIILDAEGISSFEEHEGGQHRLIYCNSYEATAKRIDEAIMGIYNK